MYVFVFRRETLQHAHIVVGKNREKKSRRKSDNCAGVGVQSDRGNSAASIYLAPALK